MIPVVVLLREQENLGMSKTDLAVSPRQTVPKKYPRRAVVYPLQANPAHNKTVCTDSNGKQASKTSTAEAFPLPALCYALPVVLFLAFCIDRTGRAFNRIAYEHKKQKGAKAKQAKKANEKKEA